MGDDIAYIITENNITLIKNGISHTHVSSENENYDAVLECIQNGDEQLAWNKANSEDFVQEVESIDDTITIENGVVFYNGRALHNTLTDRIIEYNRSGSTNVVNRLSNFLKNLMENPSFRAVSETYKFLEATEIPITADGHFLAYKKVRENWNDIHSNSIYNGPNEIIGVPRNSVDEDSSRTCSYGLHVCSFSYLGSFGGGPGNRVIVVKVNPADVVAVPDDYNNAKMRVCKYKVIAEKTELYNDEEGSYEALRSFEDDDDFGEVEYDDDHDHDDDSFKIPESIVDIVDYNKLKPMADSNIARSFTSRKEARTYARTNTYFVVKDNQDGFYGHTNYRWAVIDTR